MTILLVDDNRHFLESIEKYLMSIKKSITVVGKAYSGAEAIRCSAEMKPDLILMDLAMPEMGGLEATRLIKQKADPPRIIIVTMHESEEYRTAADEAGADGYISKSDLHVKLMSRIGLLFPGSLNNGIDSTAEKSTRHNSDRNF
ncbi:MAG: response regulator transcription factor [Ignavibacteriales bacterium]|nr:response regulator transcription factor [Ignavibacteriales bacterium]